MVNPAPTLRSNNPDHPRDVAFQLPPAFSPLPYSVLIGRGKACTEATGNKRLKVIVSTFLEEYSKAANRIEKSIIVSKIVDMVREACPVGAFIKQENGHWWEVSDHMARERVGSMLRDSLHEQYKSSSKSKLARRRNNKSSSNGIGIEKGTVAPKRRPSPKPDSVQSSTKVSDRSSHEGKGHSSLSRSIAFHPRFDDDERSRIGTSDFVPSQLPQHTTSTQQSINKSKMERTAQTIGSNHSIRNWAGSNNISGSASHNSCSIRDISCDASKILAEQQRLLEMGVHRNQQREWEQQNIHNHQQSPRHRRRQSFGHAYEFLPNTADIRGSSLDMLRENDVFPTEILQAASSCLDHSAPNPAMAAPTTGMNNAAYCETSSRSTQMQYFDGHKKRSSSGRT
ncbi:hypothetical protein IV203_030155 [Nitzschia inconspicua]|uniref:DUF6824 domain-containing protein n=1 Tax=Nitzschia inconspicua TaxID=303405 RepID=A0A9K3Q3Z4_9STRA|nr:hypothetical protein IV203_004890 [Nitzschia inconspicua]KAG7367484.1 hypothetical protein IV203_030155 [Nitzschia inconspicua]